QEDANFHAQGSLRSQLVADRRERDTAVENVVENEDVSASYVGQGDLLEDHFTSGGGLAIIAGHAQAIQLQGQRDAAKQIGHENKAAVEDGDDGQFAAFVFGYDIPSKLIEPAQDSRLIEKNTVEIFLHWSHSIRTAGKQEDNECHLGEEDTICTAYRLTRKATSTVLSSCSPDSVNQGCVSAAVISWVSLVSALSAAPRRHSSRARSLFPARLAASPALR